MAPLLALPIVLATPRPLPFSYSYDTLAKGDIELETYVDLSPAKVTADGRAQSYLPPQLQLEMEYGLTHHVELGLYAMLAPAANVTDLPELPVSNGAKQRVRVRLADEGQWPVDVALYGEIVEKDREFELEAKVILQKRIARVIRVISNFWLEREWEYKGDQNWVLNPTLGATLEISPRVHVGAEGWMRFTMPDGGEKNPPEWAHGPHVYVGPVAMLNFGRFWWASGFYLRTTDFERRLQPGEGYGGLWFRSIVGVYL